MQIQWHRLISKEWLIFAICALVLIGFYFALGVTGPLFLIAWFLAYLSFPLVSWLERRGFKRGHAVGLSILLFVFIIFAIIGLLGPWLYSEIGELIKSLPEMLDWIAKKITNMRNWFAVQFHLGADDVETRFHEAWTRQIQDFDIEDFGAIRPFVTGGINFVFFLLQLILLPIFYVYLLFHFDRIPYLVERILPAQVLPTYQKYLNKFDKLILGYIQGMFLVCCFLAVAYSIGLSLSGVKFGAIVGIIAGLLSFIPYLGFFVGALITVMLILIYGSGWGVWIGGALTFGIAQAIESYYLTPHLVGERVGLHPLIVILLIIAGANLGGLAGMIIAIPLGAMVWIVLDDLLVAKQEEEQKTTN